MPRPQLRRAQEEVPGGQAWPAGQDSQEVEPKVLAKLPPGQGRTDPPLQKEPGGAAQGGAVGVALPGNVEGALVPVLVFEVVGVSEGEGPPAGEGLGERLGEGLGEGLGELLGGKMHSRATEPGHPVVPPHPPPPPSTPVA